MQEKVWIIDFGSQYTQLIARRSRELGYSAIILPPIKAIEMLQKNKPEAIILSGGPHSIFEDDTDFSHFFKDESLPILGICYGLQIMGQYFGGKVERGHQGEYGKAMVHAQNKFSIKGVNKDIKVWMSHFDHLVELPKDFELIYKTDNDLVGGMKHKSKPLLALQFHPEVHHTDSGKEVLSYFLKDMAKLENDWSTETMVELCANDVREVKGSKVLCAFSGGVDSLVAATLAHREIGEDVYCFFVDHGLLRPQDIHHIELLKKETPLNIEIINAKDLFFKKFKGVDDPEKKRKIIGNTFIEVFEQKIHEYEKSHKIKFDYLLQGTIYPDVIESVSPHGKDGKSVTIKSHHNVGGLPERMKLKLLEPLKYLFKDEVRLMGEALGLKHERVHRHPFPGPGIGIRVLGELTQERVTKVQKSDQILFEELMNQNQYEKCWQAFTVLLPVKTVGVKGDARAYEEVICLRIVNSVDGMTATWTDFPHEFLSRVSSRITNEVAGITRVVYDITSKPPGTIEWE
jgi:GMP synthase (glutamine-hydrolysing)